MSTQQSLKARIRTADNILHIAEAMEVVASVQFHKLLHKMGHFRIYSNKLIQLMNQIKLSIDSVEHFLFEVRPCRRLGVIIVAGDKGLCGSYNDQALKKAEEFLKTIDSEKVDLFLLGKKAVDHFKNKHWKISKSIETLNRSASEDVINQWTKEYIASFEKEEIDELWIISTHYLNVLKREVQLEKILPLELSQAKSRAESAPFLFEPSPLEIYQKMIPYFFYIKLQLFLMNSQASELSSRMIAMKSAAKNAKEMIDKLVLIKNKNRQMAITNEILEISAGAESLK